MSIITALQGLGLSEKEAAVYRALVELGETTVGRIAQKSGVKRPTAYLILDELRKRGLVTQVPHAKKQIFAPKDPRELLAEKETELENAKQALPQLLALVSGSGKPTVRYYEGVAELRELLWYGLDRLESKELWAFYGHSDHMSEELQKLARQYFRHLKKLSITSYGIAPDHPSLQEARVEDEYYNRTVKTVAPNTYDAEMSIDIGDTFIRLVSFRHEHGVVIDDTHIARAARQIFEMVWATY